jgi:hypothetical protein
MQRMKQVIVRQNGLYSLYLRIPPEVVHANNLKRNDLAYLVPVEGRPDKFEVTLVKAPMPQELQAPVRQQEVAEEAVG